MTEEYLETRAERGSREKFEAALRKVGQRRQAKGSFYAAPVERGDAPVVMDGEERSGREGRRGARSEPDAVGIGGQLAGERAKVLEGPAVEDVEPASRQRKRLTRSPSSAGGGICSSGVS